MNGEHSPIDDSPANSDILTPDLGQGINDKPRNTRTSTPKVRTGCLTCKSRRVKCDETKPHCLNCLKSRRTCEGYVIAPRKKRSRATAQPAQGLRQIARVACPTVQLMLDLDALDFADAKGQMYFQEFVHLVQQPWISAASHCDLWEVTLPQLARNNSTIRQAATGIGALSVWHRQSGHKSLQSTTAPVLPSTPVDAHYFHALAYYSRSLRLQGETNTIQNAVFLSILLLIFETLRGNRPAALDHVNHGLALLLAMLSDEESQRHIDGLSPNPRPILEAVADVFTHLGIQARSILRGRLGHSAPLPNFTQGLKARQQTLENFPLLVSQLVPKTAILDRIPAVFDSLRETERFIAAAQQRQRRLTGILMRVIHDSRILTSNDEGLISDFWANFPDHPRITEFCSGTTRLSQALTQAFLPLFDSIIISDSEPATVTKAFHLRLQCMDLGVFDDPGQYIDLGLLQAQTPFFREYLSLVDMALRAARRGEDNPAYQLSLQSGLAGRLFTVAMSCRDPLVREEALWKLRDYPGHDGLWNSRALYALAHRNRTVEKANMAEGSPQEQWRRLWRREYVFEDGGNRITFRYLEKDTSTEQWKLVEETASLAADSDDVHWERQPLSFSGRLIMVELIPPE